MRPRQSRKVKCDMINTLFLTTVAVEFTFVPFPTCKHMSMAFTAILLNFFEEQWTQNHQQYPQFGNVACTFPITFLKIAVHN